MATKRRVFGHQDDYIDSPGGGRKDRAHFRGVGILAGFEDRVLIISGVLAGNAPFFLLPSRTLSVLISSYRRYLTQLLQETRPRLPENQNVVVSLRWPRPS